MTPSTPKLREARHVAGPALMILAVGCFSCMDSIMGHLVHRHDGWLLIWARFAIQALAVLVLLPLLGWRDVLVTRRPGLQLARGVALVVASASLTFALRFIPLTQAYAIGFSAPLIAAIIAAIVLGERPARRTWVLICVGLLGVVVALDPTSPEAGAALLLPIGFAISNAVFHVFTRSGAASEHPFCQLFYAALVSALLLSVALPWTWHPVQGVDLALLLAAGLLGTLAHFLLIRAFALAPTAIVSPMVYAQVAWAALIGFFVFGRLPTVPTLVGAGIVIGAGLVMIRTSARDPA